jgi:hypothetical protein
MGKLARKEKMTTDLNKIKPKDTKQFIWRN